MTLEEAKKIAEIVTLADGGCFVCVDVLVNALNASFPDLPWRWYRDLNYPLMGELVGVAEIGDA